MTRIRQLALSIALALALLVTFAGAASADPSDGGQPTFSSTSSTFCSPAQIRRGVCTTATSDPSDGGQPTP